jgi:GxxExxY protein
MERDDLREKTLTGSIIRVFYDVYNVLGFGFLEHVYIAALERELIDRGHRVGREVGVHVKYKGETIAMQRMDMIIDDKVVVEVKSSFELHKAARRQVYNYLRATDIEVGLLLHFGPTPEFYRLFASNVASHPRHSPSPSYPAAPSGVDTGLTSTTDSPAITKTRSPGRGRTSATPVKSPNAGSTPTSLPNQ